MKRGSIESDKNRNDEQAHDTTSSSRATKPIILSRLFHQHRRDDSGTREPGHLFQVFFSFIPATAHDVLLDQPLNSDNIQKITKKNVKQILDT